MSVKEAIVLGAIVLALMIGTWALIGPEGSPIPSFFRPR